MCGHGYRWEEYHLMERDEEKESIARTVESLQRTTGERTAGWFTRYGPSLNTRQLVVDHGGFIYDSMGMNDDLPYYTTVKAADGGDMPWLVVPYSMETNDARFWRGGLSSVGAFYEYLKDTFDVLYEEGPHASQDDDCGPALPHRRAAGPLPRRGAVPAVCPADARRLVRSPGRDRPVVAGKVPVRPVAAQRPLSEADRGAR